MQSIVGSFIFFLFMIVLFITHKFVVIAANNYFFQPMNYSYNLRLLLGLSIINIPKFNFIICIMYRKLKLSLEI